MFANRVDAGRRLAAPLMHLRGQPLVVLGLPRGGVPVAAEVAAALDAPLDVIIVRKLGVPFQPELGMGAIGEEGVRVVNEDVVRAAGVRADELVDVERREQAELERRAERFRGTRAREPLRDRVAVIIDDGIATGSTARAACEVARAEGAIRVVLAVPVAPPDWTDRLADVADELVALETPPQFHAIGQFYDDFSQTTDEEVVRHLSAASARGSPPSGRDDEVVVDAGHRVQLPGHLTVPERARGVVLFAHGSGSSRHSPRNAFVASVLHTAGIGTLLFDLLVPDEERDRANVFDVALLAGRLAGATAWLRTPPASWSGSIGYLGASTGAAAALWAAAEGDLRVDAVVSRGGRPDLATARLADVTAPTLLVVGERDEHVLDLNRAAAARLRCVHDVVVVPGATHLFEEPGTLELAADAARDWFLTHLSPA